MTFNKDFARRKFLLGAVATSLGGIMAKPSRPVKLGIDLFSLRGQKWSPHQLLDYASRQEVDLVHFSEIRFLGNLEPENLRSVREHAERLNLEVEIGMRSICPISTMFDKSQGTAEQQLERMMVAANQVGSKIVRAVLGSAEDRRSGAIDAHIEATVKVLKNVRSQAMDHNLKIAIENHAGDMQARELKTLVEAAGPDFVGVCLDSGNPLWTIEDPHLTLETLHPYVLTSHVRDSAVWKVPQGAAVTWVQMGRGNVDIDSYVHDFIKLCPGKPLSLESILLGPRVYAYNDPKFWDDFRKTPAWEFQRFLAIAERGKPYKEEAWEAPDEAARERAALEESLAHTKKLIASYSA
jgi:3-oxoisoapionate decarboxylase